MPFNLSVHPLFRLALLVGLSFSFSSEITAQTYLPHNYWTFDGVNPLQDSMNNSNINPAYYNSPYTISQAQANVGVGRCLTLNTNSKIIVASSPFAADTGFTIEFLFRPGANPQESVQLFSRRDGAINIRFCFPYLRFTTKCLPNGSSTPVSDTWDVDLEGTGRATYGYYVDGNWHHMVFRYDAKNGSKQIWVDGQNPAGFSKTLSTLGLVPSNTGNPNQNICDLNTNVDYNKYLGDLDEIATYPYPLHPNMIFKHYTEFTQHKHYSFGFTSTAPPAPSPVTSGIDPNEYAPGHPSVTVDALTQLKTFPAARVKPGNTLFPNVMIFNPANIAGYLTSNYSNSSLVSRSKDVQRQLVTNFNYALQVTSNTHNVGNFGDTNTFDGAWVKLANQNPSWKTSANSYWEQHSPFNAGYTSTQPHIKCNCNPNNYYLRNASGQFLDKWGNPISTYKVISPETPLDSIRIDGLTNRYYLNQLLGKMTRPLDAVFENGEVVTHWTANAVTRDPVTNAAYLSSGLSDIEQYMGRAMARITGAYMNEFKSIPALANTRFIHYQINGHPQYSWNYQETRSLNSLINGQRQSSGDIYMQQPKNWRYWIGAAHGWQFLVDSRYPEIQLGDKLFAPTVSPGWNNDETKIPRPAQWLGFLKAVAMTGAEYFHTGYFVTKAPYQNPDHYVWQMAIPGYVQALSSRYEDILRNGNLLDGDAPNNPGSSTIAPAYSFNAGDMRKLVVARKHSTLNRYAITGTIQNNSNMNGSAELEGNATAKIDGNTLSFKIRRQGSTYIYDKTNPSSPVFYQLDKWHEASHPYYWSKDFHLEGELYDNNNGGLVIRTYVPSGTPAGNYLNYTSCVGFSTTTTAEYNFTPRGSSPQSHYLWVRARSTDGSTTGFTATLGGTSFTVNCVKDTGWTWYRYNTATSLPMLFNNLALQNNKLSLTASSSKLEIDLITLTPVSGSYYPVFAAPCNQTGATATITVQGPSSFCQGGSVVLAANLGSAYLWSNGAVTQGITVNTSGTYTVTVTNSSGQSAVSAPVTITVNPLPQAQILASGPLTFCLGGQVSLSSASTQASYLWSNGATTSSINVTSTGNYTLTVTSGAGCTNTSGAVSVNANGSGSASITASGPTTFCQGSSVRLTASAGTSYLWSNGASTQSITVTTGGTYQVTVTQSGGCQAVSAATSVTVNPIPTASITASGPLNLCSGSSVGLSSSTANASYLWSNGAISPSITVSTAGNYFLTVTSAQGCSSTSAPAAVTVVASTPASITASGPTTFCQGNSIRLTASAGTSYLWSNGATTQSITADSSGSYSVTVNTISCSSTSAPTQVVVNPRPSLTVTASGPLSFCSGSSVTFNIVQSTGNSFIWYKNNAVIAGAGASSYLANTAGTYKVRAQLGSCGTFSNPYTVTIPCREGETPGGGALSVFPNPAGNTFYLSLETESDDEFTVELYDMSGKLSATLLSNQFTPAGESRFTISDQKLAPGTYLIVARSVNGLVHRERLVIHQ